MKHVQHYKIMEYIGKKIDAHYLGVRYNSFEELSLDVNVGDIVVCIDDEPWKNFCNKFGDPAWANDLNLGDSFTVVDNKEDGLLVPISSGQGFALKTWYKLFYKLKSLRKMKLESLKNKK